MFFPPAAKPPFEPNEIVVGCFFAAFLMTLLLQRGGTGHPARGAQCQRQMCPVGMCMAWGWDAGYLVDLPIEHVKRMVV